MHCNCLTSHRSNTQAAKHLRQCHNRQGSITQTDDDSLNKLKESNRGQRPIEQHRTAGVDTAPVVAIEQRVNLRWRVARLSESKDAITHVEEEM